MIAATRPCVQVPLRAVFTPRALSACVIAFVIPERLVDSMIGLTLLANWIGFLRDFIERAAQAVFDCRSNDTLVIARKVLEAAIRTDRECSGADRSANTEADNASTT
jgi:hypothetical protein